MIAWSWYRTGVINSYATAAAREAETSAREAKTELEYLKLDVERLLMITEALWNMVKEKHGYEDDELMRKINEIDLRDEKLDGRVAPSPPRPCPKCNQPLAKRRISCIYCGTATTRDPFER